MPVPRDDDTVRNNVMREVGGPLAEAAQELERLLADAEDTEPDPCDDTPQEG